MKKLASTTFLVAGLVVPVAAFWWLHGRLHADAWLAAAVAIVAGWALNIGWACTAPQKAGVEPGNTRAIATRFGWACPAVLVLLTWLAWRFLA